MYETMKQEHAQIKAEVRAETLREILECENPFDAVTMICTASVERACAVIDSLNPLSAAFIIGILRLQEKECKNTYPRQLIDRAEKLQIKGIKGFVSARNEEFIRMGIFLP